MANIIPFAFRGELFSGTHNFASGGDSFKIALYTTISGYSTASTTYVNVYSEDHQRKAGDIVRFRGPPIVTTAGAGGADEADQRNLQAFINIPTFDNVSDLNNANGFTIALGQIDSTGNVTGATTTDVLTTPINYFYITSTSNATSGNIQGGGDNCSVGPVTLEVVNG